MKKIILTLLALSFVSQSFAGVCREQLADKKFIRTSIAAGFTAPSALAATHVLLGGAATAPPAVPIIFIAATVVGGTYWIVVATKPGRLIKLIDEAQSCKGKLVSKAYKAYSKTHGQNSLSKQDFCEEIVRSDIDGSLCPEGILPSIKNVGRYYID